MAELWTITIVTEAREPEVCSLRDPSADVLADHLATLIKRQRGDIWASERVSITLYRRDEYAVEMAAADDDRPMRVGGALQAPLGDGDLPV